MIKIKAEIDELILRELALKHLQQQLGELGDNLNASDVTIEVKSKQNYRSEWETAAFRATVDRSI